LAALRAGLAVSDPVPHEPDEHLLLCLLLEHQSQADRLMPLRMLVNGSMFWENEWKEWESSQTEVRSAGVDADFSGGLSHGPDAVDQQPDVGGADSRPGGIAAIGSAMADPVLGLGGTDQRGAVGGIQSVAERAGRGAGDSGGIETVFAACSQRPSSDWPVWPASDRMRWRDLMWMLISWAFAAAHATNALDWSK
jgi:hypothetical protein